MFTIFLSCGKITVIYMNVGINQSQAVISKRIGKEIILTGAGFTLAIFLATFIPGGVPFDRAVTSLLLLVPLVFFTALYFGPARYREAPYPFLYSVLCAVWVSALILATGGPNSNYFPLFFLVLVFGGGYAPRRWQVAAVALAVCLAYVSHYPFFGIMRDTWRDLLVVRVPVYFAAAFIAYGLVEEARRMRREKDVFAERAEHLDTKARHMEALYLIGTKVSSVLKVRYVLDTVVSSTAIAMATDYVMVHLSKNDHEVLDLSACHGVPKRLQEAYRRRDIGEGIMGWVAMTGEVLNLCDAAEDERFDVRISGRQFTSLLCVPMTIGARTIGVLTVGSRSAREFTTEEETFLFALGGEAAVAIETSRLHEETEELSMIDALANLYNIRKLPAALGAEIDRSHRYGHPLSFAMLDIDFFKDYNDNHGHSQGNVVLQKVAQIVKDQSRAVDLVFRYGGEEFCVVLPETEKEEACLVAQRIRAKVETEPFGGEALQPNGKITVSIGVATYPADAGAADELIDKADEALYKAKDGGRNSVVTADAGRRITALS